jgi:hypothetical protein
MWSGSAVLIWVEETYNITCSDVARRIELFIYYLFIVHIDEFAYPQN